MPGVGEVCVAEEEEVHGDAESDVHVDRHRLTRTWTVWLKEEVLRFSVVTCVVIDEYDHHHPASPLINLVLVHDLGVARLLAEEDADDADVEDGEPEVDWGEVLVFFHEEVGSVADIEVADDDGELANTEDEVCNSVEWYITLEQLTCKQWCHTNVNMIM